MTNHPNRSKRSYEEIQAAMRADTMTKLRRDVTLISRERGPLRNQTWVRAHFENRLTAIKSRNSN